MKPRFDFGDQVRVTRNVRNDGTYPGVDTGELLIRRGSIGHVQNIGTYLQEYTIYSVHFVEQDLLVGCKEDEVIPADAPWMPSKFEFRDKVKPRIPLSINGEIIAETETEGEIIKVLRDHPGGVFYHVRFPGRTLLAPESALTASD